MQVIRRFFAIIFDEAGVVRSSRPPILPRKRCVLYLSPLLFRTDIIDE